MKNPITDRTFVSPIVAVSFAALAVTGILMFFHIRSGAINGIHKWMGWVFVVAGLIHLLLNLKGFLGYFRKPGTWIALAITVGLLVGSAYLEPEHRGGPRGPRPQQAPSAQTPQQRPDMSQSADDQPPPDMPPRPENDAEPDAPPQQ